MFCPTSLAIFRVFFSDEQNASRRAHSISVSGTSRGAGRASYVDGRQWRAGNNGNGEKGGKMATAASVREGNGLVVARRCEKRTSRDAEWDKWWVPGVGERGDAKGYHLTCSWIAIGKNDERLSQRVLCRVFPLDPPSPAPEGILSVATRQCLDR